jgi:hypothetical protein
MRRLALCAGLLAACNTNTPDDDYHAFLSRADRARPDAGVDAAHPTGHFADISGNWFLRADLTAGLDLGLRVRMCRYMESPTEADWARCDPLTEPGRLMVRLWLEKQRIGVDAPLVETSSTVDEGGHFVLTADPLRLPADLVGSDIVALVVMYAHITRAGSWCGDADGEVTQPPGLEIDGSTFAATRDPDQTAQHFELPFACAADDGVADPGGDAGPGDDATPPDAGPPPGPDGAVPRPASPDLSDVPSSAADVSGHWLVTARLANGFALQLWLSLVYAGGPEGGTLDGAIHKTQDTPGTPAAATFTTTVTPDGRFELWLPTFAMQTNLGRLEADILLSAVTASADAFCGEGAGQVRRPLAMSLEGATFAAQRFVPGTTAPPANEVASACAAP